MPGALLLHEPPGVASVIVVVVPTQSVLLPIMGDGDELTVKTAVVEQPADVVKVIMTTPGEMAVTKPDVVPIAAMVVSLLLHVPVPMKASVNVAVLPTQRLLGPNINPGNGLTVTITGSDEQPEPMENVMAVVPGIKPAVTIPVRLPTVATAGLLLLHVPGPLTSVSIVVCPSQMLSGLPVGVAGGSVTFTVCVT